MRPTKSVDQLVFEAIQAQCKKTDITERNDRPEPPSFATFLQRYLIPEVRQETHAFYGHLDTQEAKYPGLDYTHPTHRIRLWRWRWHRKLFRAFDTLKLTDHEISSLTHWEGTKWAKEKYETEQGIKIRDTTADDIPNADDLPAWFPKGSSDAYDNEASTVGEQDSDNKDSMDIESEDELRSVGLALNMRLRAQAARRAAGDTDAVLDEEWEQWLKACAESGQVNFLTDEMFIESERAAGDPQPPINLSPSMIPVWRDAVRSGNLPALPDHLHPMLRRSLGRDDESNATRSSRSPRSRWLSSGTASQQADEVSTLRGPMLTSSGAAAARLLEEESPRIRVPWPRRTYSDLRLPARDMGSGQRTAEAEASGA